MRNKPTARKYFSWLGWPAALALHVVIVAATLMTWSDKLPPIEDGTLVPVDLVTLDEKTNVAPMTIKAPAPDLPKPELDLSQTPPLPPPEEEVVAVPEAKPAMRPQPPKKREQFDIDNIMAFLDKKKPAKPRVENGRPGAQNVKGIGAQDAMTADLRTLMQSQIYRCWSPPVGAPHPERLIVSFRIFLNPDGSIANAPQYAKSGDPYVSAAQQAALRAIYTCAPYKLPADRYGQWRDVTFVFDPRDMLN